MDADYFTDTGSLRWTIASSLFESINGSAYTVAITADLLASATSEITYDSYYNAPDTITLTLVDPAWQIQTSGICDRDSDELLPMLDFNFPYGTDVWWRLDDVSQTSGDLSTAGLTLLFQHRVASYLQEDFGPLKVAPGTTTRAQFVKQLCDRIPGALRGRNDVYGNNVIGPGSDRSNQIQFICPELNVVQPLQGTNSLTTPAQSVVVTKTVESNKTAQVNKSRAIGYGVSNLTCKGAKLTNSQIDVVNAGLQAADQLNAPGVVMIALIYAGMGESSLGLDAGTSENVWQANNPGNYGPAPNWSEMATAWLQGTKDFESPGGIAFAKQYTEAWQIANATEGNAAWDGPPYSSNTPHTVDSYAHEWSGGQAQGIAEATKIVAAYGGSTGGSTTGVSSSSDVTSVTSDVGELRRGSTDNPDEDSLTCIENLASGVNWEFYIVAHATEGEWGNYVHYRSGPNNDSQMPSAYLTMSSTNPGTWDLTTSIKTTTMRVENCLNQQPTYDVDNTAFTYQTTKTRHGKVQVAAKIVQPQTPTQIQLELNCVPMTYAAGDVFVFANSGPLNGRWLVSEIERNFIEDDFDQITLVPPTAPDPEPTITTTASISTGSGLTSSSNGSGGSSSGSTANAKRGSLADAVKIATQAAALEASQHCYTYTEGPGRTNDGNGVLSPPYTFDCSGFCGGVYETAGLPAPYGADGYTGTTADIEGNMTQVSQGDAVPGDLALFEIGGQTAHVVVYIGNGQCVSMGAQGEPAIVPMQSETDYFQQQGGGLVGYFHLSGTS